MNWARSFELLQYFQKKKQKLKVVMWMRTVMSAYSHIDHGMATLLTPCSCDPHMRGLCAEVCEIMAVSLTPCRLFAAATRLSWWMMKESGKWQTAILQCRCS